MKKDTLFRLVASLSKAERRQFRLSAAGRRENSRYRRLFDLIAAGRPADDAALRRGMGGISARELAVLKHYLSLAILKHLRGLHADCSPTARILALLEETELLFERELFDLCGQRLAKAEALAEKNEAHALACEAAGWRRALELAHPGAKGLQGAVEQEALALSQLSSVNRYWRLTAQMAQDPRKAAAAVGQALGKSAGGESYRALVLRRHLGYARYLVQGKPRRAEGELKGLIALMESRPDRIEEDPGSYGAALGNLIALHLQSRKWHAVPPLFAKIPSPPAGRQPIPKSTRRMRLRLYNLQLEFLRDTGRARDALPIIDEIAAYLERPGAPVPEGYLILFHYQFACLLFQAGNASAALRWLNVILARDYGGERRELQAHARLLSLAVHYELGNLMLLRYAVDGHRRYFRRHYPAGAAAKILFRLFARLSTAPSSRRAELFAQAASALGKEETAASVAEASDYFDWPAWVGSRAGSLR